jgi:hypothetical protein
MADPTQLPAPFRPLLYQHWSELVFLHWPIAPEQVQARLPEGLAVDCFGGQAWLSVVPFHMSKVRLAGLPAVPGFSTTRELNLRTYVVDREGRRGVWFFSLDATHRIFVEVAKRFFHLPYRPAKLLTSTDPTGWTELAVQTQGHSFALRYRIQPEQLLGPAVDGTLDHFLLERYRFFTTHRRTGRLVRGEIYHAPYQRVAVEWDPAADGRELFATNEFPIPAEPPARVGATLPVPIQARSLAHD